MGITTTGKIPAFYPGEFWKFSITITKNGSAPDISSDVVTCTVKDTSGEADADAGVRGLDEEVIVPAREVAELDEAILDGE